MKKNLIEAALTQISAPTETQTEAAAAAAPAVVSTDIIEALKAQYGAKWATAVRRGNPYGRELAKGEGEYTRATFIVDTKQQKALNNYAKAEGLTQKEALELVLEIGLIAITGKGSQDITVTPEDVAPKFSRSKK